MGGGTQLICNCFKIYNNVLICCDMIVLTSEKYKTTHLEKLASCKTDFWIVTGMS